MTIKKKSIPQRNDIYIIEKIMGDEIVLYNKSNHNIHNLNKTAAILWNLCDGKMAIGEMIKYLHDNFKENKKTIEDDVMKTLEEMENVNLITFKI